jgi:hypothetical protein
LRHRHAAHLRRPLHHRHLSGARLASPSWENRQVKQEGAAAYFFLLCLLFWDRARLSAPESRGCVKPGTWCAATPPTESCIVGELRSTKCATLHCKTSWQHSCPCITVSHEPTSRTLQKNADIDALSQTVDPGMQQDSPYLRKRPGANHYHRPGHTITKTLVERGCPNQHGTHQVVEQAIDEA